MVLYLNNLEVDKNKIISFAFVPSIAASTDNPTFQFQIC